MIIGIRPYLFLFLAATLFLAACGPAAQTAPTQDVAAINTQAAHTVVADLTRNAPPPTVTEPIIPPPPTEAAIPTPVEAAAIPTLIPNLPVAVVPTAVVGEPAALANHNTTIYSGPGRDYAVYGAFLGGSTARVIGSNDDRSWWVVSVPPAPDGKGWIEAGALSVNNADAAPVLPTPPLPPTTDLTPPGPDDPQAMALANVHVRSGPGRGFPSFGIAKAGQSARLLGRSKDSQWWVVRLNPATVGAGFGWVMAEYTQAINTEGLLTIDSPPAPMPVAPPPAPPDAPLATSTDNLNVRQGPGTHFPALFVAPPGSSAVVTGRSADSNWWQVRIATHYSPDGLGWVMARYTTTQNLVNVPVVDSPPAPPVVDTTPPENIVGCALAAQEPVNGTVFSPGFPFKARWLLQNTSSVRWTPAEYELRFVGAAGSQMMHQGPDRFNLPVAVEPGGTTYIILPMLAPFDPGTYAELWRITRGNQTMCQFYLSIEVR